MFKNEEILEFLTRIVKNANRNNGKRFYACHYVLFIWYDVGTSDANSMDASASASL